jgi:hypothetical protein
MNKETRVRPSLEENCDCVLDSVASRALQHSAVAFENTKAVGVATVHSAKAIGTTTN